MQFINDFLRSQPDGGLANYGLLGTIGQGVMMLAVLLYFFRLKPRWLEWIKGAFIGFLAFEFCVYAQHFFTWYHSGFALDSYEQVSNIAVAFTALPLSSAVKCIGKGILATLSTERHSTITI